MKSNLSVKDRPDYSYWKKDPAKRPKLSGGQMAEMLVELANYSKQRFPLGARLFLDREYFGIPSGTGCTVIRDWPRTEVRWDKWSKSGYGAMRSITLVSFALDEVLK